MRRKGQAINIDWTIGLGLFLLTALTTVLFILNAGIGGNEVNSLTSKAYEVQNTVEEVSSIRGSKIPIIVRGPENISNIPVDRSYAFTSDAYPNSGSGNIPADLDVAENQIVTVTDTGNITNYISYFSEEVSEINYNNDISTGEWINNSKISVKPGSPGLESLIIDGNELLNPDANLGSGTYSINEQELHAETLSGDLRVYNGSSEMILDDRSDNITFNLNNLDTLYWHKDSSTTPLDGTGTMKEGATKGFTIASNHGITFLGNLTATVSKPDSSTVRVEIDAEKLRIRLHNSSYESGEDRIRFYDKGYIVLGASQKFSAPYQNKIRELNSLSETDFENSLDLGNLNYNIGFGPWIQNLVNDVSDWNNGDFNATSATRKDNSGDLGLGYQNGSSGDSLVGYWRMDENSDTLKDYSGNKNDGTKNGASTDEYGIFGTNSAFLDGSDDTITVPDSDNLDGFQDGLTISVWVYSRQDEKGDYSWIIQKNTFGNAPYYWADEGHGNGNINARIEDSQDNRYNINPGLNYREWTHVTVTYNPETGNYRGFKNGEITSESNIGDITPLNSNDQKIKIGEGGPESPWKGRIDELRIYRNALSEEEVRKLYRYGRDGTFNGDYVIENQTQSFQDWDELRVNADVPEGTNAEVLFESLDSDENTIDRQIIDLESGKRSYSIDSDSSVGYRMTFRGSSNDPEKSWEIRDYNLIYGPELSRGMNLPLDTSTVVLNRGANIVDRNGSFSSIENQVVLWR